MWHWHTRVAQGHLPGHATMMCEEGYADTKGLLILKLSIYSALGESDAHEEWVERQCPDAKHTLLAHHGMGQEAHLRFERAESHGPRLELKEQAMQQGVNWELAVEPAELGRALQGGQVRIGTSGEARIVTTNASTAPRAITTYPAKRFSKHPHGGRSVLRPLCWCRRQGRRLVMLSSTSYAPAPISPPRSPGGAAKPFLNGGDAAISTEAMAPSRRSV